MTIRLPAEYDEYLQSAVAVGKYTNETEVVIAALDLLKQRDVLIEAMRKELLPALDRVERGEGIILNGPDVDTFFDDVLSRGNERDVRRRKNR